MSFIDALRTQNAFRLSKGRLLFLGALGLGVLALAFPAQAWRSLTFVIDNMLYMTPVIVVAVGLSASIRASGADKLLAQLFQGRMATMILLASLFGAITPICGIGVLPIIAGLLAAGVPLAPIMAFWLSSPITAPPMLAITAGALGMDFAVGKTLIAFGIGILGGLVTDALLHRGGLKRPLKTLHGTPSACESTCGPSSFLWIFWQDSPRRQLFWQDARDSTILIVKWLAIAFALESLIRTYLPPEAIAVHVGTDNAWAIPLSVAIGIPLYLDGYAALPLVRGLMDLGMTPGAAMAFLVAGGITSLYASVAVFALVRLPVFLLYIALAIAGSALGGYGYEAYVELS